MYTKSPESKDSVTIEDQAKAKIDILCYVKLLALRLGNGQGVVEVFRA